ncbi:S-layer family protein [Scytonema hofmannii FACHB-248]|uniref:S-layer family protein n=1 Tax=Scytonema hofmannii FACHB-248 TaxID=1842502 RepID=A0ABR8GUT2_9CYAN|nr:MULTISPECIES: S-layer family protein [Nostocales]MBD2606845.1 S-layer family protein [Scytonema hofmannii FACHB-248]
MFAISIRYHWLQGLGIVTSSAFFFANCALAQITPDITLPTNSRVRTSGNTSIIEGGTQAGTNLFHSFQDFSVLTGSGAYFNNGDIQNIISRVTGQSRSNIDGLIRANGSANLFLINPNGIVFGPNASLNIGGSFIASTASSLKFDDGFEFSATAPQIAPLLTVSVPIGLQFGSTAGNIINRSQALPINANTGFPVGLRVPTGKTLALVGGDVTLDGGNLTAAQGRIELGSVAGSGLVKLTSIGQGYALGYADVPNFGDILLTQGAIADTSGNTGGTIQVQGNSLSLVGSFLQSGTTLGSSQGGNITINAPNSVTLSDSSQITTATQGTGNAGNVRIDTGKLVVRDGSLIQTLTLSNGNAGDLTINAGDSVELIGTSNNSDSSQISTATLGTGNAGNLRIDTGKLVVRDGAQIQTLTLSDGKAGDLTINTRDSVELIGTSSNGELPSSLLSQSIRLDEVPSNGDAGNIAINTDKLIVRDGAFITTATVGNGKAGNLNVVASDSVTISGTGNTIVGPVGSFLSSSTAGSGNAGDISIDTGKLVVQGGAQILTLTDTNAAGNGGNLTVNARNSVEVTGRGGANAENPSILTSRSNGNGNAGNLTINTGQLMVRDGAAISASSNGRGAGGKLDVNASESVELAGSVLNPTGLARSGLFAPARSTGKSGDLNISTRQLIIRDGAIATVSSTSTANDARGAGNITITAPIIRLDNQGQIVAESRSGNGGDIRLQNSDLLLLRRNSGISTSAGSLGAGGNGGNIDINAKFIVTLPQENSDITANSFQGRGGNVTINTVSNFGLIPRSLEELRALLSDPNNLDPQGLVSSDITAISLTGNPSLSGQVTINSPEIDASRTLVSFFPQLVDLSQLIAQSCSPKNRTTGGQFIVTGRGGLPPDPYEPLSSEVVWSDTRLPFVTTQNYSQPVTVKRAASPDTVKIIPAIGWVFNDNGEVTLVGEDTQTNSDNLQSFSIPCH